MENNISQRISLLISKLGYNKNSFSKAIGIKNNVTIGRIINENRHPSYDILDKILQTFSSVDANWLFTGKGEMLKSNNDNGVVNGNVNGDNNKINIGSSIVKLTERGKEIYHELEMCNLELKAVKEQLAQVKAHHEKELKMKDEIIELLKGKK